MVIKVAEKVSESMNMFSGNSNKKNKLVKFVLDDPHMIWVRMMRKKNNRHECKEQFTEFGTCNGVSAAGTKLYNWKTTQSSNGPAGLGSKIEKENKAN
jgi:hypothetical protein